MVPNKMRAAFVTKPNNIVVETTDVPKVDSNDILIRVKYCGICGTDVHILKGDYSSEFFPLIPGHEFVGHVAEVGSNVTDFCEGDFVTADINMGCGKCFYCRQNQVLQCKNVKQLGIHTHGAFAEYVSVPQDKVYRLTESKDMPAINWTLLEPISCVVRAAKNMGLKVGDGVAIIGAGSIGLTHLQMAKICGAAPIIVIGRSQERLEYAKEMGADHVLKTSDNDVELVRELTDGRGPDIVIESVGTVATYERAFKMVRPGGKIMAFGLTGGDEVARYNPFQVAFNELSIFGSCAGMGNDVSEAIKLMRYNRFSLEHFTSTVYPLENISQAFDRLATDKKVVKALISMY